MPAGRRGIRPFNNFIGLASATSEDGRIIGGSHSFGLEAEAVLWIDRRTHVPEGLPARQRRAERVRGVGQHRVHHRPYRATAASWSGRAPGRGIFRVMS